MKKLVCLTAVVLFLYQSLNAQSEFKNPGLVFHTCKHEVVMQKKAKAVVFDKNGKRVFGRVTAINSTSFVLNSDNHPNTTVNFSDISQLRLRNFGLPSKPKVKFMLDLIPPFALWHILTAKRFYFNSANTQDKVKNVVLDYDVKEMPLKGLHYGKSVLCK